MGVYFNLLTAIMTIFSLTVAVFSDSTSFNHSGCGVFVLTKTIPIGSVSITSKIDSRNNTINIKLMSKSEFFDIGLTYSSICNITTKKLLQNQLQSRYLNYSSNVFYNNETLNLKFDIKEEMLILIISSLSSLDVSGIFQVSIYDSTLIIGSEIAVIIIVIASISSLILYFIIKEKKISYEANTPFYDDIDVFIRQYQSTEEISPFSDDDN